MSVSLIKDISITLTNFPAPSAPPTSVKVLALNSTAVTVQWGPVPCIEQNGDITGYSVQYWEVGSGSTQTMPVSGGSATEADISGLLSNTKYVVEVAAVNSAGIGVYSGDQILFSKLSGN